MPATPTYVALAEVTLAATATEVTLPVPSGYRDLVLVITGTTGSNTYLRLVFNGDTGANYTTVRAGGDGSSPYSTASTYNSIRIIAKMGTSQTTTITHIMDYAATDKHKTVLQRGNTTFDSVDMGAGRWANTAAITSITASLDSGSFDSGSTMNLYGIEA